MTSLSNLIEKFLKRCLGTVQKRFKDEKCRRSSEKRMEASVRGGGRGRGGEGRGRGGSGGEKRGRGGYQREDP